MSKNYSYLQYKYMKDDFILTLYSKPSTAFSLKELSMLFPDISYNNMKSRVSYYAKRGKLKRIRKSMYAKHDYNPYELATKIYTPSYLSLETVLEKEGIIFQDYTSIFVVSYTNRTLHIDGHTILLRRLEEDILLNKAGIIEKDNYFSATKERAFLDAIYLYKNYHFDNLRPLEWNKIMEIRYIYKNKNKTFEKRVESYYKLYRNEYV